MATEAQIQANRSSAQAMMDELRKTKPICSEPDEEQLVCGKEVAVNLLENECRETNPIFASGSRTSTVNPGRLRALVVTPEGVLLMRLRAHDEPALPRRQGPHQAGSRLARRLRDSQAYPGHHRNAL